MKNVKKVMMLAVLSGLIVGGCNAVVAQPMDPKDILREKAEKLLSDFGVQRGKGEREKWYKPFEVGNSFNVEKDERINS